MADYTKLKAVLELAFQQSAEGKGRARHANGRDFDRQPILEIGRMVGSGYATGQMMKKAQEAHGMSARGDHDAAVQELLGAIVYAAAAVILIREMASTMAPPVAIRPPSNAAADLARAAGRPVMSDALKAVDEALNRG